MAEVLSKEEKVSILLVDDRPENLTALKAILYRPDYDLVTAASGPEALGKILKNDFAVILLDIFMPEMDGFEVASIIKSREKSKHIPIIFLTAMSKEIETIYRAYDIGAVDYIQKPLESAVVRAKVAVFAELYRKSQQIQIQSELLRLAERREREREVAEVRQASENKYQELVEGIKNGIVWTSNLNASHFSYVSPQAEQVSGYSANQWLSEPNFLFNHLEDEDHSVFLESTKKVKEGQDTSFEHRFRRPDGRIIWLHTSIRVAAQSNHQSKEVRGISVDITPLKLTEEALREAVRIRDEFLSIASHELKTPITPLKLQIQTLARTLKTRDIKELSTSSLIKTIDTLNRQIERLSVLIDSLLDVSRITSGKLILTQEELNLSELVPEVLERYQDQLKKANYETHVSIEPNIDLFVDRLRIEQVLSNLITNAIKYGNAKPIEIQVSATEDVAKIIVKDQGIGIKQEDQSRVFNRFERAVSATHFGGLGLGLYITHQIVHAHGGRIRVESEINQGSTFIVELPIKKHKIKNSETNAA
jgi:PAS domain S-box-containing protein